MSVALAGRATARRGAARDRSMPENLGDYRSTPRRSTARREAAVGCALVAELGGAGALAARSRAAREPAATTARPRAARRHAGSGGRVRARCRARRAGALAARSRAAREPAATTARPRAARRHAGKRRSGAGSLPSSAARRPLDPAQLDGTQGSGGRLPTWVRLPTPRGRVTAPTSRSPGTITSWAMPVSLPAVSCLPVDPRWNMRLSPGLSGSGQREPSLSAATARPRPDLHTAAVASPAPRSPAAAR